MRTQEAFKIQLLDCAKKIWLQFYKTYLNPKWQTEYIFKSPNREDKNPSIYINPIKNVWYDNGGGHTGGGIISFINHIFWNYEKDTREALKKLDTIYPELKHPSKNITWKTQLFPLETKKNPATAWSYDKKEKGAYMAVFEVIGIKKLYSYPLKKYLSEERHINLNIADDYIKEIEYRHIANNKTFYWIGFKSGDTYAVRQKFFKGFIWNNPKITIFEFYTKKILLFEWFIDFLSYLTVKNIKTPPCTAIVLNSAVMIGQFIEYVKNNPWVDTIDYFRDRDPAGLKSLKYLSIWLPNIEIFDVSKQYKPAKDVNDWLVSMKNRPLGSP